MIESVIEWSIRNRFLVVLLALSVGALGLRAAVTMPVDAIPDLSENQVIVFTDWIGRSPQEVEDQVTFPLSVNLQGLAGVKVVRSSSEFNFSIITIIFDDETDYYFARQRVLEKLSIATTFLPPGVTPYLAPDATAVGQIFWYTVEGSGQDLGTLRAIQDWYVRYQLNSVPGVSEVATVGGAPREYQIDLDPNALRAYGVSLGEVFSAVQRSNSAVGGRVIHQGNAEYLVRSIGWIESLDDIRSIVVSERDGVPITLDQLGAVQLGPGFRRGVLEKDGREMVGGVVLMRYGENPLAVTSRIHEKIAALQPGLPEGVRIVPFYDRTPLIRAALDTVTDTVKEEIIICTVMIAIVMGHLGGAFVVSLTLPMAVLLSFLLMRIFGVPSNIMSLAGIAISVGILEDQAVVMTENAAHHLTRRFGSERVRGDIRDVIIPACRTVGRPIFFSVLITILSFLPVFALTGIEGKMFHPLAYTKTFALIGVAILSITLVPALIPIFLKGRIKSEDESWLVRTMTEIFRPMLAWLMDRPGLVCWLFMVILGFGYLASTRLGREFMPELNEGSIMNMPTTVPRASVVQVTDDLKARDAVLRQFPEVWQVVGKAGRAETATDPAPLDMIETLINLRDRDQWPKRQMRYEDVLAHTRRALGALTSRGLIKRPPDADQEGLINDAAMTTSVTIDSALRALAVRRLAEYRPRMGRELVEDLLDGVIKSIGPERRLRSITTAERAALVEELMRAHGDDFAVNVRQQEVREAIPRVTRSLIKLGVAKDSPNLLAARGGPWESAERFAREAIGLKPITFEDRLTGVLQDRHDALWNERVRKLDWELFDRCVVLATTTALQALEDLARERGQLIKKVPEDVQHALRDALKTELAERLFLWRKTKTELVNEMDSALQVPGWGNIWTQPIINRINMLATGVRSDIGVRVFGGDLTTIQTVSQDVARVLRTVPGAVDVFPDQIVGKGYVEIDIDRAKAARYGIQVGDVQDVIEVALGGRPLTVTVEGRERYPVRVRYARDFRDDVAAIERALVAGSRRMPEDVPTEAATPSSSPQPLQVPLKMIADVRVVEGPSTIKSENGLLRAFVQLNVRDRDTVGFVEEAQRAVAAKVKLPAGVYLEWSGQFENQVRARKTLRIVFPAVIVLILVLLYLTYHSWVDAALILPSVLGALAGGAMFQWFFGFPFSVAVWVGYIACFGMAIETGIVMMVYLREAIAERGGLANIASESALREAVLEGAIHRLRPKLLTEGTTIIAIAPMLWASGVGAEVIRPMAAPVLGGLLIADEVIDVFLPVLYFTLQKRRWKALRARGAAPEELRSAGSEA